MNGWGAAAVGVVALGGVGYVLNLKRLATQIETIARANIHKFDLGGLTIRVDVTVKNPTSASLKIKYPFVKLIYKGNTLGSSQAINQDIKLNSYGEAVISGIMIQIPIIGLVSVAAELFKSLKAKGEAIKMQIKTITTIDLTVISIPYDNTNDVTIKS